MILFLNSFQDRNNLSYKKSLNPDHACKEKLIILPFESGNFYTMKSLLAMENVLIHIKGLVSTIPCNLGAVWEGDVLGTLRTN